MDGRKRYCKNCGAEIRADSKHCSRCGIGFDNTPSPVSAPQKTSTKIIKETRRTCNVCGKVWHYGKQEQLQNVGNAMSNLGKSMSCCTGCLPAVFIPDKKVVDLNKCPNCGSKNIKKEQIAHEVAK
jgi:uncharacterized membrane protein YvbJ